MKSRHQHTLGHNRKTNQGQGKGKMGPLCNTLHLKTNLENQNEIRVVINLKSLEKEIKHLDQTGCSRGDEENPQEINLNQVDANV